MLSPLPSKSSSYLSFDCSCFSFFSFSTKFSLLLN
jgi:hypothetical protein